MLSILLQVLLLFNINQEPVNVDEQHEKTVLILTGKRSCFPCYEKINAYYKQLDPDHKISVYWVFENSRNYAFRHNRLKSLGFTVKEEEALFYSDPFFIQLNASISTYPCIVTLGNGKIDIYDDERLFAKNGKLKYKIAKKIFKVK